jgi:hypothetical protein
LQVKESLMDSSVPSTYWKGKSVTGGIGNAANALGL